MAGLGFLKSIPRANEGFLTSWKILHCVHSLGSEEGNQWKPQILQVYGCVRAGLMSPQVPMPGLPGWTRGQAVTVAQTMTPARPPLPCSEMWDLNPGKTWAGGGQDSILLTLGDTVFDML